MMVQMATKKTLMDRDWRRLRSNPADLNDYSQLELSRAWEPSDSSGALPLGEAKETLNCLSNGDHATKEKNGLYTIKVGISKYAYGGLYGMEWGLSTIMEC